MCNSLFDLNADGRLDAMEQTLEYLAFLSATGRDAGEEEAQDPDDL